ncbi:hypothetical protein F0562_002726 [Nyssa sinensis]|uniref:Uncharacterized protein n=1 Tax=Nyssa sinensis TaxID=561372 RepID=A0A5J5BU31_9ASTE|nr:hypothetical protein F0562_002726 [Nyssa sinensis]
MAKRGFSKASHVIVAAIFVTVMLLMFADMASAIIHEATPELTLGRRALADYDPPRYGTGGGGYVPVPRRAP